MQGLAAVEATAEGDEDGRVGRPHSRPGWARLPQRLSHFNQAPGPDPAHYHQNSCGANAAGVGGPHRGKGEGGRWTGVREGGIVGGSRSVWPREGEGKKTETATQAGEDASRREMVRQGERRRVKGGASVLQDGGRGRMGHGGRWKGGRGIWEPIGSCEEKPILEKTS